MQERFETFTVLINRISRDIRKIKNQEMADYHLRSVHVSCLYYVYSLGNVTSAELCEHCEEDKATISRAVDYLETNGFLLRDTGATISPFNAFLLLQGTETLSLRIERHVENTKKVVEFLANHPQVEKVNHPSLPDHPDHALYEKYFPNGGASIFTFNIKGGREEAFKFIDNLKVFSLLANVADVKSLVIHPASTTHSQLTDEELAEQQIYQNTIRLSIGTEHIDDIIADLEAGFAAVRGE